MDRIRKPVVLLLLGFFVSLSGQNYHPIDSIQGYASTSPYEGQNVLTRGVVTAVFDPGFFIEEKPGGPWHGIYVYTASTPAVSQGDSVEVSGEIAESYGNTQFSNSPSYTVLASNVDLPLPVDTTAHAANQERYEGVFLKVRNSIVVDTSGLGNYDEWFVFDNTDSLLIDNTQMERVQGGYAYIPAPGDSIREIKGVGHYSFSSHKLLPRRDDDITLTTPEITIFQIQGQDSISPYLADTVTTAGIVTGVRDDNHQGYYLQEKQSGLWRGVFVFTGSSVSYTPGDSIRVRGIVGEYSTDGNDVRTEINLINDTLLGQTEGPSPLLSSTGDLSAEAYEGVLVSISSAMCESVEDSLGIWEVDDGSGLLKVANALLPYQPVRGHSYKITGILDYDYGYNLLPRDSSDIEDLSGIAEVTIYDIQHDTIPPSDSSIYVHYNQVRTRGIVTAQFSEGFFIEESEGGPWSGIYVYSGSTPPVSRGDSVEVTGNVDEHFGATQISGNPAIDVLAGNKTVPAPVDTNLSGITGEKYEGVYVKTGKVVVSQAINQYDEWEVTDGISNMVIDYSELIGKQGDYAYEPQVGDTIYSIRGPQQYSFGNYAVFPREDDDIQLNPVKATPLLSPRRVFVSDTVEPEIFISLDTGYVLKRTEINLDSRLSYWDLDSLTLEGEGTSNAILSISDTTIIIDSLYSADSIKINLGSQIVPSLIGKYEISINVTFKDNPEFELLPRPALSVIEKPLEFHTIKEIQGDGYSSPYEGSTVWTIGTVTGPNFSTSGYTSYMQGDDAGINIYSSSLVGLNYGVKYLLKGTIEEYNGLTEFTDIDSIITLSKRRNPVSIDTLSISDGLRERLEGNLIHIEDAIVSEEPSGPAGGGYNATIKNGQTAIALRIEGATSVLDSISLLKNERWSITGIVGQYDSEEPYTSGYQLLPRFINDFTPVEIELDTAEFDVTVSPNPFAPDAGEITNIIISTSPSHTVNAWIFDSRGREKIHLIRNHSGPIRETWDGKSMRGENLTIGTYILLVREKGPDGKETSITYPVVIGTELGGQ